MPNFQLPTNLDTEGYIGGSRAVLDRLQLLGAAPPTAGEPYDVAGARINPGYNQNLLNQGYATDPFTGRGLQQQQQPQFSFSALINHLLGQASAGTAGPAGPQGTDVPFDANAHAANSIMAGLLLTNR